MTMTGGRLYEVTEPLRTGIRSHELSAPPGHRAGSADGEQAHSVSGQVRVCGAVVVTLVLVVSLTLGTARVGVAAGATSEIVLEADRVTIRCNGLAPSELIGQLAHAAGAELHGKVEAATALHCDLVAASLQDALTRLLVDQPFTLTYTASGGVRANHVLATPRGLSSLETRLPLGPPGLRLLRDQLVSVAPGPVATALRARHLTLEQLLATAMRHPDPGVRADAVRAGIAALDAAPPLMRDLLTVLVRDNERLLSKSLQNFAQENAREVVVLAAAFTQTGALRQRAAGLLRELRACRDSGEAGRGRRGLEATYE